MSVSFITYPIVVHIPATASCGFAGGSWLLLVILDSGDGELSTANSVVATCTT